MDPCRESDVQSSAAPGWLLLQLPLREVGACVLCQQVSASVSVAQPAWPTISQLLSRCLSTSSAHEVGCFSHPLLTVSELRSIP